MLAVLMLTQAAAFSPAVFADGEGIAVMAAKEATNIVLREYEEPFTLTYNYDGKSVKQLLIDNLIDWESSKLPSDSITIDNFNGSSNFMVDSPKSILFLLLPKCPQTQTRSL